jgi:TetR/AcrR family transcriptional repressor of nem operon
MARPKEFEREMALQGAIGVFSQHGYEGTSTDVLTQAMGINRQSMYDTFGDKWRLYLEALQHYVADSVGDQLRVLNAAPSAIKGLQAHLDHAVDQAIADPSPACLGLSAICEFGRSDPEVTMLTDTAGQTVLSALKRRISEAKMDGDVPEDVDVTEAANFIKATIAGIKIAARAGAPPQTLRGIARTALRALH